MLVSLIMCTHMCMCMHSAHECTSASLPLCLSILTTILVVGLVSPSDLMYPQVCDLPPVAKHILVCLLMIMQMCIHTFIHTDVFLFHVLMYGSSPRCLSIVTTILVVGSLLSSDLV